MGTGPYLLVIRESDAKSTFRRNPGWWGKHEGNVEEIVYTTIKSDATRMAALAAGDLDVVLDPPLQDIERLARDSRVRVYREPENLVFFLGMDQARDELLYSDLKGKTPSRTGGCASRSTRRSTRGDQPRRDARARGHTAAMLPTPSGGVPNDLLSAIRTTSPRRSGSSQRRVPNGFAVESNAERARDGCTRSPGCSRAWGRGGELAREPRYFARASRRTSFYLLGWAARTPTPSSRCSRLRGRGRREMAIQLGRYKDPAFERWSTRSGREGSGEAPVRHQQGDAHAARKHSNTFPAPRMQPGPRAPTSRWSTAPTDGSRWRG